MRNCKPKMEIRMSSIQWARTKGIGGLGTPCGSDIKTFVMDPDGWDRSNYDKSIREKITEKEFNDRMLRSTVIKRK